MKKENDATHSLDIQSADQVVRHVALLIEGGKLRPGDRLVPERELAQELGVSRPTVRAGLHAGEALRHDDDFYGRTVVIAARISALALGGEILASELVYALTHGLGTFTFGEPRPATLKGLEGEFNVYPVLA